MDVIARYLYSNCKDRKVRNKRRLQMRSIIKSCEKNNFIQKNGEYLHLLQITLEKSVQKNPKKNQKNPKIWQKK